MLPIKEFGNFQQDYQNHLNMKKRIQFMRLNLILFLVLFCFSAMAQERTITGKITDVSTFSIPSVTVVEKGTSNGVITNIDGHYQINVSGNDAILIFSFIGMESQEIVVGDQTEINVMLKDESQGLDEVVVVGYGVQRKVNVTGAVSSIGAKDLEERPVANIAQALQGLVPNLALTTSDGGRPGSSMNWSIRGTGTIGDSKSTPLIIIDGVPGDPNLISPEDIENISVLKDAAASAIYGSRAPYGVVIITTKKGTASKMKVNFSANLSWKSATKMLDKMGSIDFMEYMNEGMINNGQSPYFSEEYFQEVRDHLANPNSPDILPDPTNPLKWGHQVAIDTDWFEEVYKDNAPTQRYNLSLSGGSEKVTYYVSLGSYEEDGLYRFGKDKYKRYNGLVKVNAQPNKWLELNIRSMVARTENNRPNANQQNEAFRRWPVDAVIDPNGNFTSKAYSLHIAAEGGRTKYVDDSFNNTFGMVIKPFKDFRLNMDFSYNTHNEIYRKNNKMLYEYGPEKNVVGAQRDASSSYVEKRFSTNKFYNTNIYANYIKSINEHNFTVLAGFQQEYNHWNRLQGSRDMLINENIQSVSAATGTDIKLSDGESEWASRGYFARLNYDFAGKYLIEINGRYDGSSRFPEDYRWGLFPSASIGYNIARENYFERFTHIVSMFKLRASYGQLGNSNVNSDYYSASMARKQSSYMGAGGAFLDYVGAPGFGNNSLTWEKPTTTNIGIDLAALDNKIQVTLDWYRRVTKEMVGPSEPLPSVLGVSVPKSNNTEMVGTGWELTLKHRNRINDFHYDVTVNVSHHEEKIASYYNPNKLIDTYYKDKKLGEIWGFKTDGFINTADQLATMPDQSEVSSGWGLGDIMYQDLNNDGAVTYGSRTLDDHGDLVRIGNTTPDFEYNISASCNWKNFDFSMFWRGMGHADWWPGGGQGDSAWYTDDIFFGIATNKWNFTALNDHKDHWTSENKNAYYPRPLVQGGNAERNIKTQTKYLQNRAFLRLKNVQLGYTLPKSLTSKIKVDNVRFYITGENLFTLSDFKIYDPETPGLIYPLQKSYSIGLKLNL